ncbi:MAG: sugar transferase [Bacteroidaceae bacterium]|nr:sugar transferase [Bacteroidaceae bacterium]
MIEEASLEVPITDGMNSAERATKRVFDVVVACLGIVVLSPLFFVIYILLHGQGDGPVLFRQERIGYGGRAFRILKFRTMAVDTEEDGEPRLTRQDDGGQTRIGRFLRERHLDELPQLFNVLRGEMSFVGPRPERKFFIDKIMEQNADYRYIFLMRPGTTSMATLYNGYTDTMEKMLIRLQMDLEYYQRRSLWTDLKILFTTAKFLVAGKRF